uniref:Uncharacterized protein n=1 Tax=Rhizophora mucronata TaxID=61149 RepID=A0A2P2N5S1_RHIMU
MGSPISPHSKGLTTFSTHERFDTVLPLVMRLKGSKIFERLCSRVINVVLATRCAAIARKPKHACWLSSS